MMKKNFDNGDKTLKQFSFSSDLDINYGLIISTYRAIDAAKANDPCVELKDICLPFGQVYAEVHIKRSLWMANYQYDLE